MSDFDMALDYRTARAMYPHRPDLWHPPEFLYDPIPIPLDHPELPLFERLEANPSAVDPNRTSAVFTDPIPARMLNEFVYCPRLFYYEFVDNVFVESIDTERGSAIHKKVDKGRGDLPSAMPSVKDSAASAPASPASAEAEQEQEQEASTTPTAVQTDTIHSRSATLGSDRLGVLAKMDLVEVQLATISVPASASLPPSSGKSKTKATTPELDLFATPDPPSSKNQSQTQTQTHVQSVTPVDYKVGSPRIGENGVQLWDADKMQLGLQILILRDNHYHCDQGVIYYKETRQRVPLQMTPELEQWIINHIEQARQVAASPVKPEPLLNSPKCVRCSLAPVCLPDETRFMQRWSEASPHLDRNSFSKNRLSPTLTSSTTSTATQLSPRRLIAARDDERALYLNTQGARVTQRGEVLIVKEETATKGEFRLKDLSHLALFGNIQITTQAIQTLCEAEIPVAYFSQSGWFYGITRGHGLKNVFTRIEQFNTAQDPRRCLALAQRFVHGKIRNHRTQLMRNHVSLPDGVSLKLKRAASDALAARSIAELLGIEGAAANLYFQNFAGLIKVNPDDDELPGLEPQASTANSENNSDIDPSFTFDFNKRSRRPPADPVNALLSFAYSILAKDCTLAALAVGYDPYIGFYHQPRHGRPALALDLMEEFRPLIAESAVLTAINNRMITPAHFVRAGDAINLTQHGRKAFFQAYEQRINSLITHPIFDYKASYRRIIELQARMLARYLTGEIPEYVPMMTR
ncbi:CRISPR-associated endonuclease Cas1 [Phragmitibacter flavus]|uniref:CRISPR-associated endonuclease Cas1 n=1 Tax=Phragmitibacter flavus TaxID=2576071 RepID=A0A5R8KB85_9BACT|nr:CRISPR-associated endonuclease Cas1 [Phragmitibacter flavus]TLD68809.1 CRISPR-associated endonuclease Cas1 [Phragmitibacter flavus]